MSDPAPITPTPSPSGAGPIVWDKSGAHFFETGVDHGVLYIPNVDGVYSGGVAWNGLTTVTESPEGAEASKQYADNIAYLTLVSAEEFKFTIEAFTYPDEFGICDGTFSPLAGFNIGQQARKAFGLAYRTKVGNDTVGQDYGYKLHLIYGATAAPSEKEFASVNDSPEAITFSWECTSNPVSVPNHTPASLVTLDSTKLDQSVLSKVEEVLYGTADAAPRLPLPEELFSLFGIN